MNASDYIGFAAKLAATYSDAASCRSAISRAYYGAFHIGNRFFIFLPTIFLPQIFSLFFLLCLLLWRSAHQDALGEILVCHADNVLQGNRADLGVELLVVVVAQAV